MHCEHGFVTRLSHTHPLNPCKLSTRTTCTFLPPHPAPPAVDHSPHCLPPAPGAPAHFQPPTSLLPAPDSIQIDLGLRFQGLNHKHWTLP